MLQPTWLLYRSIFECHSKNHIKHAQKHLTNAQMTSKSSVFLLLACFYTTINFFALYQVCKFALRCNKFEGFAPCELSVMWKLYIFMSFLFLLFWYLSHPTDKTFQLLTTAIQCIPILKSRNKIYIYIYIFFFF